MEKNFDFVIKHAGSGEPMPFVDGSGKAVAMNADKIIFTSVNTLNEKDKNATFEQKMIRGTVCEKLLKKAVDYTSDELSMIKQCIGLTESPYVLKQLVDYIDGK